jgi:calcineurin-like phosphoesterase
MTGSYAGVIGMDRQDVIKRFTSAVFKRAEHATGNVRICAAVIDIDETTGRAREISRLSLPHEQ